MKEIELTQGKVALVDDRDYVALSRWTWFAHKDPKGCWYAGRTDRTGKQRTVHMHRQLLGIEVVGTMRIDHKNGDGLDNQRDNLRTCTHRQNGQNQKLNSANASGYKGVDWKADRKKYRARITVDDTTLELGFFNRVIDAAVAYDQAAQIYFREFARLNFSYDPACYI